MSLESQYKPDFQTNNIFKSGILAKQARGGDAVIAVSVHKGYCLFQSLNQYVFSFCSKIPSLSVHLLLFLRISGQRINNESETKNASRASTGTRKDTMDLSRLSTSPVLP
jgi:hypothetical protein